MTAPPTLLCTATFPGNTGFAWDFIERLYAQMADRLVGRGVRTLVAYPEITEAPRTLVGSAAIPVVLDTQLRTRSARSAMADFVRRENVQVVYFTDRSLWNVRYRLLRRAGVRRIIVHDHTSGVRSVPVGIRRFVKRLLVNFPGVAADVVVAVSDYVAERDHSVALLKREKIRRVWNGIDPLATASDTGPDVREKLGIGTEVPLVACACRATREKGVDVLFRAFDVVCRESEPEATLVYIGNGPQLEDLAALRDSLACAEKIHLLGYMSPAAALLRTANVCVVPSVWQDAFPLAVLEMMVRGRPIVATKVGGVPEMIEDGVSGILVEPNDVDALAEAIATILRSPASAAILGEAARERASQLFSADQQISEMLATFQSVFDS